jgi:hypothetical protein
MKTAQKQKTLLTYFPTERGTAISVQVAPNLQHHQKYLCFDQSIKIV